MRLTEAELQLKLKKLLTSWESEVVEYKEAKNKFSKDDIGEYFSAISNEANLNEIQFGWLIFGVEDKNHEIVGTNYMMDNNFNEIKKYIYEQCNGLSFINIYSLFVEDSQLQSKRVVMFQIPAAEFEATSFKKIFYGREGESLVPLSEEKKERIRHNTKNDWSRFVIENASISDLDTEAIELAKLQYLKKNSNKEKVTNEVLELTGFDLLNKIGLTLNGKITNTTLLLLGKEESSHYFGDKIPRISWILENSKGEKIDYEHFSIPFILNIDRAYAKIRNLRYRYMPSDETVYSEEEFMYEPQSLREIINNCIVHQDYSRTRMVSIIESDDKIIFRNEGYFIPENVEKVLEPGYTPPYYRNRFLSIAMVNANLIDTIGSGIRRVFTEQQKRFLPLPDYDLTEPNRIKVILYGKVLNKKYSSILFKNKTLSLNHVLLLDRVQKGYKLSDNEYYELLSRKLIEGPKSKPFFSGEVSDELNEEKQKVINEGIDDIYYEGIIKKLIRDNNGLSREKIDANLLPMMPQTLSLPQKRKKIGNLLKKLREANEIENSSISTKYPNWIIKRKL